MTGGGKHSGLPATAALLGAPRPNRFPGRVRLEVVAPGAGRVRVAVFDGEGRRVATLMDGERGPGCHPLEWDGLAAGGAGAPAGVCLVRVSGFGWGETRLVVRMR